ncbi:hypothetical protein [Acetobacter pasteurianus]|uniref:hypothetical protein n=1 Tax=Acetobacter pasteurianus TaxID=438 RepID=UPI000F552DD9|nr:hypothetical protein [Acetobacter pasteurianus]
MDISFHCNIWQNFCEETSQSILERIVSDLARLNEVGIIIDRTEASTFGKFTLVKPRNKLGWWKWAREVPKLSILQYSGMFSEAIWPD